MGRRGRPPYPDVLTPREFEVLELLRGGLSNDEIAERLGISLAGAKYHVSEILGKLGVANREEAAAWQRSERPWWAAAFAPVAWVRRLWLSQLAAGAAAIAVAAGIGLFIWGLLRTDGDEESLVAAARTATPTTPVVSEACPGGPTAPSTSAPLFAYATADGTIWVVDAGGTSAVQLICRATDARNAAWSASGRYLGHAGEDGALRILDVETGQDTVVDDGTEGSVLSASVPPSSYLQWSPVGDALIYEKFDTADRRLPLGFWKVIPGSPPFALVESRDLLGPASWSPDGQLIAYQVRNPAFATPSTSRTNQIFIARADGSDAHKLTDGITIPFGSPWSPDGRLLAYWKNDHGGSSSIGDVYIMDVASEREFSLGEFTSDEHPQWSPDPNRDIFYHLAIDPETLSATSLFGRPSVIVNWSPDGSKVAYIEGPAFGGTPRSLVVLDLASDARTTLYTSNVITAHASGAGVGGLWSPDGRYYAFSALQQDNSDVSSLFVANMATGEKIDLLDEFEAGSVSVSYAPDSSHLLIQQGRTQSPSIWLAQPDGFGLTKVADGLVLDGSSFSAPWRPAAQ